MRMKCIVVNRVGEFETANRDIPKPDPDEVLLKVSVTGLCRTDLKIIRVGHRDLVLPRIPGEEVIGIVQDMGDNAAGFEVGQRVYAYPGVWCGACPACGRGAENLCKDMQIMGFHRDGGFAEYVLAPVQALIPVPEELSDDHAVLAEPLSCCLNALELARIAPGKTLCIWGAGPAGTLLRRAAIALGATPTVVEPDERRRKLVDGLATAPGDRFDICIPAVGSVDAYREAITRLGPRGTMVVFSGLAKEHEAHAVDLNHIHYLEQTVVGAYGCCYRHGEEALKLLAEGKVVVDDMISHRLPLEELDHALSIVENREGMKVLLYP